MCLVEGNEGPVVALKQREVGRPEKEVLQHRVIGQQDVRRAGTHLFPAQELVGQPLLVGIHGREQGLCVFVSLLRLPGVAAEGQAALSSQQCPKSLDLVVGQRVHRVEEQRTNSGPQLAAGAFGDELVDDRDEEGLGLARSGPGGHDDVSASHYLADGLFLVLVQRSGQGERGTDQ